MIKRRIVLTGLAATAATPILAQGQSARAPASGNGGGPEARHVQQTMAIGSLSLAVSRIAVQKGHFPKVKEFAQFEVAEQETVADVLKSLQNPGAISGMVKPPTDAELQEHLGQQGRETVKKMQSAQAGVMFDRDYLMAQTEGHETLLKIQEDYLKSGRNLDSINVAKLASGQIKEHLRLLADIDSEMGGASTTGAAPRRR
jgi:putative membrane protein